MTISSEINRSGPYDGNSVTTVFDFDFRIVDESHLSVIKTDAAGIESELVIGADYTVSGVGDASGGQITLSIAPKFGEKITILRKVPFTQQTDLENQGAFFAETIEAALDLAVMRDQELSEKVDRAFKTTAVGDRYDAGGLRFSNLADGVDPQDAATVGQTMGAQQAATAAAQSAQQAELAAQRALAAAVPLAAGRNFAAAHNRLTLESLRITAGQYAGGWRATGAGGLNWYFTFAAMVLSNQFTTAEIKDAVETCLETSVVGAWEASTTYAAGTKVVIGGKIFFVNIAGTTGASPPDVSGISTAGEFVGDGTVTWEYMGMTVPNEWEWFIIDVLGDLSTLDYPDSHDAYAGMLASAALKAGVDATWLNAASIFPGKSRLQLIGTVFDRCITDTLQGLNLASTFQGDKLGDGTPYPIKFIADNCDAWRGAKSLAGLYAIVGDAVNEAAAEGLAATLKSGVIALWDDTVGRFRTYQSQTGHGSLTGDEAFVTNLRFHAWPILHDMWTSYEEWVTYADPVISYTIANTPGLWLGEVDEFAIAEWYFMAAKKFGWLVAKDTLAWRVTTRPLSLVTLIDIALNLEAGDHGSSHSG